MNNDDLNKLMGIGPSNTKNDIIATMKEEVVDDSFKKDFELAQSNIRQAIMGSGDVLSDLATLATSSQDPKAYDSYSKVLKSIADTAQTLLNLHDKIQKKTTTEENTKNQTNIVFAGSTDELGKIIESMRK